MHFVPAIPSLEGTLRITLEACGWKGTEEVWGCFTLMYPSVGFVAVDS